MNLAPSSMALGLDQIPESLLPAIACRWVLPITVLDIALVTALFFVGELVAPALYTRSESETGLLSFALFRLNAGNEA